MLGALCLVQSYKYENIAIASVLFIVFNIVTLVLVSWFYFGEKISDLHMAAIALALGAVALLEFGK